MFSFLLGPGAQTPQGFVSGFPGAPKCYRGCLFLFPGAQNAVGITHFGSQGLKKRCRGCLFVGFWGKKTVQGSLFWLTGQKERHAAVALSGHDADYASQAVCNIYENYADFREEITDFTFLGRCHPKNVRYGRLRSHRMGLSPTGSQRSPHPLASRRLARAKSGRRSGPHGSSHLPILTRCARHCSEPQAFVE